MSTKSGVPLGRCLRCNADVWYRSVFGLVVCALCGQPSAREQTPDRGERRT